MISLKTQIDGLIRLQELDKEIYAFKRKKEAAPGQLQLLQAAFDAKKKNLADLEAVLLNFQKEKKDRELELGSKEESIKKLQTQLYQLKTNKEYQTMLGQIEGAKADASLAEDKILEAFNKIDKGKSDVEQEKIRLSGEEKLFNADKKKIDDSVKEIDDRIATLEGQRKQVLPEIDPKVLAQYDRILVNRDGLAIVPVPGTSCGGCNMLVPPQVINLIKMYERIIQCENCGRMLYIPDDNTVS